MSFIVANRERSALTWLFHVTEKGRRQLDTSQKYQICLFLSSISFIYQEAHTQLNLFTNFVINCVILNSFRFPFHFFSSCISFSLGFHQKSIVNYYVYSYIWNQSKSMNDKQFFILIMAKKYDNFFSRVLVSLSLLLNIIHFKAKKSYMNELNTSSYMESQLKASSLILFLIINFFLVASSRVLSIQEIIEKLH